MYKWKMHLRPLPPTLRSRPRLERLYAAGFTKLEFVEHALYCSKNRDYYYYNYTTTHTHASAMMMHLLKHPDDGIVFEEELHDV